MEPFGALRARSRTGMFAFQTIAAAPGPTLEGAHPEVSGEALAELFAALLAAAGAWARPGVMDRAGPTSDAGLTDLAAPACRGHRETLTAASTAGCAQPDHFRASGRSPWSGPPLIDPDAADQGLPPLARPQADERPLRVLQETAFAVPVEIASEQLADKQSDSVQPDRPRSAAAPFDPGIVDQGLPPLAQSRAAELPLRVFQERALATSVGIASQQLADDQSGSVQPDRPQSTTPPIDPVVDQGLPPLARLRSDALPLRVFQETVLATSVGIASQQLADDQSGSVQPDRPQSTTPPIDPVVDQGLPPLARLRSDALPLRLFQETALATPAGIASERLADKKSDSMQPELPRSAAPPIDPGVVDQGLQPLARSRSGELPLRTFQETALATPAGIVSERLADKQSDSAQPNRPRSTAPPINPGVADQGLPPLARSRADGRPIETLQTAPAAETSDPSSVPGELEPQGAPPVIPASPVSIESPAALAMPPGEPPSPFAASQLVVPGPASNVAPTTDGWEAALALRLESVQPQPHATASQLAQPEVPPPTPAKADFAPPAVTADLIRQPAPASGRDPHADADSRREHAPQPQIQDAQPAAAVPTRIVAQADAPPERSTAPPATAVPARPGPPEVHSADLEHSPQQTQFRLVLRDDRLGRVSLHLTERAGLIDLMVRADKPATARALQDSLPSLIDALAQRNFRAETAPFMPPGGSPDRHEQHDRERRDRRAYEARPRLRARRGVNLFPAAAQ